MYTSCWLLPWYYYCDVRLYYCDIRTTFISDNSLIWWNNSITQKTCNRKYTWLPFLVLAHSGYSIWGTENCICFLLILYMANYATHVIHAWSFKHITFVEHLYYMCIYNTYIIPVFLHMLNLYWAYTCIMYWAYTCMSKYVIQW